MKLHFASMSLLFAVLLAGCSRGPALPEGVPDIVPAAGTVTSQGAPLAGATVVFLPVGGTHAASALTDETGRFMLTAFPPHQGAVAGEYQVTVSKTESVEVQTGDPDSHATQSRSLIAEKYADAAQSGLTATIPAEGIDTLKFELE